MKAGQWARVEGIVATQYNGDDAFPGLRAFAEDVARGRYGNDSLSSAVLARGGSYANSGRSTYENERMVLGRENGYTLSRRILGALDHCVDCIQWAALGWIPTEEMEREYPIGAGVCSVNCHCAVVQKKGVEDGA